MKLTFTCIVMITVSFCHAQISEVDFDALDSIMATAPEVELCSRRGNPADRTVFPKPEKGSNFIEVFLNTAKQLMLPDSAGSFQCEIYVEINCKGQAGNYRFSIEPRTFHTPDFEDFKRMMRVVYQLKDYSFKPASHVSEIVNSSVRFRYKANVQ